MDCWSNVLCVWYQSAYTLYGIFVPRHSITKLSLIFGFIIFSPLCCNYLLQNGTWFRLVETYRRLWHFDNVTWFGKENVQHNCTFFVNYELFANTNFRFLSFCNRFMFSNYDRFLIFFLFHSDFLLFWFFLLHVCNRNAERRFYKKNHRRHRR